MKIRCAYDKLVKIEDLKPNPQNPNRHGEEQIRLLSKIIESSGFRNPIVVSNRSGFITKGHARLEASKKLGLKEVPVNYQDYDSDEQEIEDMLADNKIAELAELSIPDTRDILKMLDKANRDLELTGFSGDDLKKLLMEYDERTIKDEIPYATKYEIIVECKDEKSQKNVFDMLTEKGFTCRVLTL